MAFCFPVFSICTSYASAQTNWWVAFNCEDSNICSSAPLGFRLMTDFIKEMILAIKTVGTRDPYLGQYVSPAWFEGNQFNPPKEGLVSKLIRNLKQKMQSVVAVTAVFTDLQNFGGLKDMAWWFIILFKRQVFLRDYKTLMEIDTLISDKKYELGLWGWWTAELTDVNQKMFQKIFDKYGPNGAWLFTQATINTNATYRQITTLMMRINSSLKTFIASPGESIHQFTGEFTKTKLFNDSPDIDVAFNLSMMVNMHDNYQCPMQCDGSRTKFKANISKIWKSFGSGSVQAMKTITDATKRLSIAMWGGGGKTTANEKAAIQKRNQELLRSQFGLKTADATTWFFGLKNYRKQFDSASKKFSDGWSAMKTDLGENNQRVALFSSPPMSFEKRKAAREEVNAAIATMEGNRDVTKKKRCTKYSFIG